MIPGELRGQRVEVAEAASVLSRLGLVTAYGHVSARSGISMLITPAAEVASWRAVRDEPLPRLWPHLRRRGEPGSRSLVVGPSLAREKESED